MRLSKTLLRISLGGAVLLLLLAGARGAVHSQTEPQHPEISAQYAWNGVFETPGWAEIQVTLTNEGPDWTGELLILDPDNNYTYRQPVSLPTRSNKFYRIPFYVQRNAFVSLQNSQGTLHHAGIVPTRFTQPGERVCAISDARGQLQLGKQQYCDVSITLNTLQTLPETHQAWDVIDVLIINATDTSILTPAQQEALLSWVGAGGHLVLSGGAALPQVLPGMPPPLRSATPGATLMLEAPDSSGQHWQAVALINPHPQATPLLTQNNALLAIKQAIGVGRVDLIGWDLNHTSDQSWLSNLWVYDTIPATAFQDDNLLSTQGSSLVGGATTLPIEALPRLWLLLLFVPLYILLMGPGTLFIVRRLRRPVLAWVLLPTWIVLTVLSVALMLNSTFSRALPASHELALITIPGAGLPARGVQITAIYAPGINRITWRNTSYNRPVTDYSSPYYYGGHDTNSPTLRITHDTDNYKIEGSRVQGVATWTNDGLVQSPLDVVVNVVREQETFFTGQIRSDYPIQDLKLIYGTSGYTLNLLETVPANRTTDFSAPLNAVMAGNNDLYSLCPPANPHDYYGYWAGSNRARMRGCYLIGVLEGYSPFPNVALTANRTAETCFFYVVPCPQGQQTSIVLTSSQAQTDQTWIDDSGFFYIQSSEIILVYHIPDMVKIEALQQMTIQLEARPWADPKSLLQPLRLELWDWRLNEWAIMQEELVINQSDLVLNNIRTPRYITADGDFHIRLTTKPLAGGSSMDGIEIKMTIILEE